jgi:hypothetical protein
VTSVTADADAAVARQYRQGDVLVMRAEHPLAAPFRVRRDREGRLVLAAGGPGGHAHVVDDPEAELFDDPLTGQRFLRLVTEAKLTHEEHDPIALPPGLYEVRRQRAYHPAASPLVGD